MPQPQIGVANQSAEVVLERLVARSAVQSGRQDWANQVPVASGVARPTSDRRRAIDLVHQVGPDHFASIELKIASDTPLYAAVEILGYAVAWMLARNDPGRSPNTLLDANTIDLCVLAPKAFYRGYELTEMERVLDREIHDFGLLHDVSMSFAFVILDERLVGPNPPETVVRAFLDAPMASR